MIRTVSKYERLEWGKEYVHKAETGFFDIVFREETSIQMESHRRFSCQKASQPPKPKPTCRYMYMYMYIQMYIFCKYICMFLQYMLHVYYVCIYIHVHVHVHV